VTAAPSSPRGDAALTEAAAELWALLHNGRRPEGYWDEQSRRYYRHVVTSFLASPSVRALLDDAMGLSKP